MGSQMLKALIAYLSLTLGANSALACSPAGDYIVPTSFELVGLADLIIVAKVIDYVKPPAPDENGFYDLSYEIQYESIEIIKGEKSLDVVLKSNIGDTHPSDTYDITSPHIESWSGSCVRTTHAKDSLVVFFLQQDEVTKNYFHMDYPFTRVSEDIPNLEAPWFLAVKKYVEIQQQYEPTRHLEVLSRYRDELMKAASTETTRAIVANIAHHISTSTRDNKVNARLYPPTHVSPAKLRVSERTGYCAC